MHKLNVFFKDLWFIKKTILFNIGGIALLSCSLVMLLMWSLDYYTLHNESIETPDLINMKVEEAVKLLETRKLNYIVVDSICRGKGLGGIIKQQNPRPSKQVKESRKIYLTITSYTECTVNLYYQRLIGRDRNYVVRYLERSNLKVGNLSYKNGGKAKNTVIEAYCNGTPLFIEANAKTGEKPPTEPKKVKQNATIDLVLLKGEGANPKFIPDLMCDNFDAAEFAIKTSQFNLGNINTAGPITDSLSAWIYNQSPAPGEIASMGRGIDLWLVQEYPEACKETPEEENK